VQAFLLVAELQSFTRAARGAGHDAGIRQHEAEVERVLGKRLVERSPRAVALTAAGSAFVPNAAR